MYTYKRIRISKSTAKTFLFLLAAAFVAGVVWIGCGDEGDPLAPESDQLVALAPGGGTEPATFTVEFDGDVPGGPTLTKFRISRGTTTIGVSEYGEYEGENMPLDMTFFHDGGDGSLDSEDAAICFPSGEMEGYLQVTKRKGKAHPSGAWFWFSSIGADGEPAKYVLMTSGTFPDEPWPPNLESGSITIPLYSWKMTTEGKQNKSACTGEGNFQASVTVTRIE